MPPEAGLPRSNWTIGNLGVADGEACNLRRLIFLRRDDRVHVHDIVIARFVLIFSSNDEIVALRYRRPSTEDIRGPARFYRRRGRCTESSAGTTAAGLSADSGLGGLIVSSAGIRRSGP